MFDHYQHFHYDHYVYHHHYHLYPYRQHNNHHSSYCCYYYYHHQLYHQYDHHYHHYLEHYLKNLLEHCHSENEALFRLTFGKLLTINVKQEVNNLDFPKLLKMELFHLNTPDTRLCSYLWQQSHRNKETNNFQKQ